MTKTFKVGDVVCFKASFLRSVGWYTNVPTNGHVDAVQGRIVRVTWCDDAGRANSAGGALDTNLILYSERSKEPA